ncbi:MAG: zincin-like metallopeptidase domain-containing protein [Acidiphilium sp.]|nr:zincin-like metallopeptidase domain-containing protein [Acidiphilium sp.]
MNKEYAEEVAARIIEQLEQGTAPWQKPWEPGELRLPYNAVTGKEYRGMNTIWLHMQGYGDPRWMTYKQSQAEGAQVRKGERGTKIIYWKFHDEQPMKDAQGRPVLDEQGQPRKIRVELERPRVFTAVVFNAEQIDGLPPLETKPTAPEPERHARAETILTNSQARISHVAGDRAFYRPSNDSITLPERHQFGSADAYYATALHELGHWTGHPSRLDRDLSHPFGSEGYAREELRAEIASLMVGERLEIGHDPGQHAAYVASWIKALKEDPREIFRAASDAERITGYVMAFEQERAREQTPVQAFEPGPTPEAAEAMQADHAQAVPSYSPLESWQNHEAVARELGIVAAVRLNPDASAVDMRGRYVITYGREDGSTLPIQTDMFTDGKAYTSVDGTRLSAFITEDHESQRGDLLLAVARVAEQEAAISSPDDPQQLRDEANRRELHALQRAQTDFDVQESDRATGETFARLLDSIGERDDETGQQARDAARYFGTAYADMPQADHTLRIGYDLRTGTGTAAPARNLPPIVNAVALRALSGGARPELTEAAARSNDLAAPAQAAQAGKPFVQHQQPEDRDMTPQRTYLAVPYREKNDAKKLGAKWDKEAKSWYAPEGVDPQQSGLARWLPENANIVPEPTQTPEAAFADAIRAAGLRLDGPPVMDGKIHRLPVEGDRGSERSGAYAGHMEGRMPGGYIENYKAGERINWKFEGKVDAIRPEEAARLEAEARQRQEQRATEMAGQHERMATVAAALWDEAEPATAENAYCAAKGITQPGENGLRVVPGSVSDAAKAAGVRIASNTREAKAMREAEPDARVFLAGDLLVPARDGDGKLWSVQTVNPRFKGFMKEGRKAGLFTVAGARQDDLATVLQNDPAMPLVLAEGYATADTVARLTGRPVVVAFDSGNLDAVARELRERWPDRALLIAADNDHLAAKELLPGGRERGNVGATKAQQAAENHKGGVMLPRFAEGEKGSDWNDYAAQHGDEAARKELARQMAEAKTEATMNAERMVYLAREREAEAVNDPTTSADDEAVARERGAAQALMGRAIAQSGEVRAQATDALAASANGQPRPVSAVTAGIDREIATMRDEVREERTHVLDGENVSTKADKAQQKPQTQARRSRGRDYDAGF